MLVYLEALENLEWLRKNTMRYYGKWVSLSRGMCLGLGDRYVGLFKPYYQCDDILITRCVW